MRESMVFYRSFYEAIKEFEPEDFKKSVMAIVGYGLDGVEPETNGVERSIFILAKAQIDANIRRYENGLKGGRKKAEPKENQKEIEDKPTDNQNKTKHKPNHNQDVTETKPNVNDNVNVNENVNDNYKKISAPADSGESPCAGKFLLNDGSEYMIAENDVEIYQQLYPGIDVRQEIRSIEAWCLSNPKNRKTRNGAKRFMNSWLSMAQNSARPEKSKSAEKKNKFNNFPQRDYDYDKLEKQLLGVKE